MSILMSVTLIPGDRHRLDDPKQKLKTKENHNRPSLMCLTACVKIKMHKSFQVVIIICIVIVVDVWLHPISISIFHPFSFHCVDMLFNKQHFSQIEYCFSVLVIHVSFHRKSDHKRNTDEFTWEAITIDLVIRFGFFFPIWMVCMR